MREKELQTQILEQIGSRPDVRLWRANVGTAVVPGGRVISFGVPGQADLSGIVIGSGRRLEVEVKGEKGRQSKQQKSFEEMILRFGGIYVLARSVGDVERAIDQAKGGQS